MKKFSLFLFFDILAGVLTAPYYSSEVPIDQLIVELGSNYDEVNPEEGSYLEGDIMLKPGDNLQMYNILRNGMIDEKYRWPNGVIPFEIEGEFSNRELAMLNRALEDYHEKTCVQFIPHTTEDDFLAIIKNEEGCWSYVGRRSGRQEVNLSSKCFPKYGIILHELMHALGFFHEQSRHDRDQYVEVMVGNVRIGKLKNFQKVSASLQNDFGVEYDYGSLMHYPPNAFSKNGQPTLVALDLENPDTEKMGQRIGFSYGDLLKINSMYACNSLEGSHEISSSIEEH